MDRIGEGKEFVVYSHPDRPSQVIKNSKELHLDTTLQARGRYYVTKILHALEPTFFPDIHLSAHESGKTTMHFERVRFSPEYEELEAIAMKDKSDPARAELASKLSAFKKKVDNDPEFLRIMQRLGKLGVTYFLDTIKLNIAYDSNNHPVYVDQVRPWMITGGQDLKGFDVDRLREEILSSFGGRERERYLRYIERYRDLYHEAVEEHIKSQQ